MKLNGEECNAIYFWNWSSWYIMTQVESLWITFIFRISSLPSGCTLVCKLEIIAQACVQLVNFSENFHSTFDKNLKIEEPYFGFSEQIYMWNNLDILRQGKTQYVNLETILV